MLAKQIRTNVEDLDAKNMSKWIADECERRYTQVLVMLSKGQHYL